MKIVVIGDGKVGRAIVQHTCKEGHEVVVIDKNPKVIEELVNTYDAGGICGNGACIDIQESAGVAKADLVVAATSRDEVNMLACLIAKKLGAKATIARVRSYEYNQNIELMKDALGIQMTINPELEAANEIMNIINFPEANRVDTFANGNVDLVELFIPENSPLIGLTLANISTKYQVRILVCAVQRGEEVFIPTGNFTFQAKDKIHITASRLVVKDFLKKLGLIETKMKDILVIGGGKISTYLADQLIKGKYNVKIIEKDYERCLELSELLPGASIVHGDGSDQLLLEEEGLDSCDAIVCLTNLDEENIIISLYAQKMEVSKIITKVNKESFAGIVETIGVASVISPKEITSSRVISYVRSTSNIHGSNIVKLYKLVNNRVEAIEFIAKKSSKLLNVCLKDLKLKKNVLIASIIRNSEVIIPSGMSQIEVNDSVIVVTTGQILDDLNDILE
ncbi:MAG: Trk system potassium transporter TrkA [Bacilli bacterium]|nr:Trk system potassium transporter TrkA [Bacilli bacterium]